MVQNRFFYIIVKIENFIKRIICTGDIAQFNNGYYRILGRASADIIKSGGHKISALQIETELLSHPQIADCAVVGLPDPTWGERVIIKSK